MTVADIRDTLAELATMRTAGTLSTEEYALARASVLHLPVPVRPPTQDADDALAELAAMRTAGTLTDDEYKLATTSVLDIPRPVRPVDTMPPATPQWRSRGPVPTPIVPRSNRGELTQRGNPWVVAGGAAVLAVAGITALILVTGRAGWSNGAIEAGPDIPERSSGSAASTSRPSPSTSEAPQETLGRQLATGSTAVGPLIGSWIPQLSAKRVGTVEDGLVYDEADIRRHVAQLKQRFPQALLVWSGDYASFRQPDFYVVVMPVRFDSGEAALSWCVAQRLGPDDCFAKRLSHSGEPAGHTMYQR